MSSKLTRGTLPENFTLTLALVDALPVLFFGGSCLQIARLFDSRLFLMGAALCLLAGAGKVLWKVLVATVRKNIWILNRQMRVLMPIGFLLMLTALILGRSRISLSGIAQAALTLPSAGFFGVGVLGMVLMTVFAFRLDGGDVRANWLEQITNGIAQACFFVGLLLL